MNLYSGREARGGLSEEDRLFTWIMARWLKENPEAIEKYKEWFRKKFL